MDHHTEWFDMIELALKRPVTVLILFLIAVAFGVFAVQHIQVDLLPDVKQPSVSVRTIWPQATPETIQKEVSSPIDEITGRIAGVTEVTSESYYGHSTVNILFERDVHMDYVLFQLKEELAQLRGRLPRQVWGPDVRARRPEEVRRAEQRFFEFKVSAGMPLQDVRTFVRKEIQPRVAAVDGVSNVQISGGSDRVVKVLLDRERLHYLNLTSTEIGGRLSDLSIKYAAQPLISGDDRLELLVDDSVTTVEELANAPVAVRGDRVLLLKDVAVVRMGYGTLYSMSRVDGMPTISVMVEKTRDANTIDAADRCRRLIADLGERFPNVRFEILEDAGEVIGDQVSGLAIRAGMIIVLVLVTLIVFLMSLRTPLVIALTIVLSSIITVDLFYLFDLTINFVSLSGLALGFGMMVDNAIVVAESIIVQLDSGKTRSAAVLDGTREIAGSIVASTLTTVGGFFAFVFLSGRLAALYLPLALAIVFSLMASLAVAFTLIPMLFFWTGLRARSRAWIHFEFLRTPLTWVRRFAPVAIALVLLLGWGSYRKFDKEVSRGDFFFQPDTQNIYIRIRMPGESDIGTIDDVLQPFESRVVGRDGVEHVVLNVYRDSGAIKIGFTEDTRGTAFPFQIKQEMIAVAAELAGITVSVSGLDQDSYYSSPGGGGGWMNSHVTITGYSYDRVKRIAESLSRHVLKERRVNESNVEFTERGWWGGDQDEMVIRLKAEAIRRNQVSVHRLVSFISQNLETDTASRIRMDGEEINLEIRFEGFEGLSRADLLGLKYETGSGQWVRLGDLISFDKVKMGSTISKKNQKYLARVEWNYRGSNKRARAFNESVFEELVLPPGYTKEIDTTYMTGEEQKMIYVSYLVAIVVIFLILAAYFESLVLPLPVLLSVPFGMIGVFLIFVYGGYSFDSSAYMGMILLFGIVVNNAILYVDHYRHDPQRDPVNASLRRVRPVLLTTLTTVVGMLPLVLNTSGASKTQQVWVSLGIATIGGLSASAILIIGFMPAFIVAFEKLRNLGSGLKTAWLAGWFGRQSSGEQPSDGKLAGAGSMSENAGNV